MKTWFIRFGTESIGPLTSSELRQLAREGGVRPDSQISRDGNSWFRADSLPGLQLQQGPRKPVKLPPLPTTPAAPSKTAQSSEPFGILGWPWWLIPLMLSLGRLAYTWGQRSVPAKPRPAPANSVTALRMDKSTPVPGFVTSPGAAGEESCFAVTLAFGEISRSQPLPLQAMDGPSFDLRSQETAESSGISIAMNVGHWPRRL